jgi:hypothetical protein
MQLPMNTPSHQISERNGKVVIHGLEVFCAYDPKIDGDHDAELKRFDNDRVREIVDSTNAYMSKGSMPRLVVMHERDGNEPKSSVGRFTKIAYEERGGVGYIVGDCEVEREVFDRLLASNAFPRRSAEIWQDQNHLSEVALLGRETPRRPLPDTNFSRRGELVTFSRPLRFDMGTVGGGQSTYVPNEVSQMADDDLREEIGSLRAALEEMKNSYKKQFAEDEDDDDKMTMESDADDMLVQQFAEEEGDGDGIHIDIDSHEDEDEDEGEDEIAMQMDEEDKMLFPASRRGRADIFAMRRENARMARELREMRAELAAEKFSRELDAMEQDGYRIPSEHRPRLISELAASREPDNLIEAWRDLFARNATGVRVDMGRASLPKGDMHPSQISDLVREHAGDPVAFAKAVNSRIRGSK